MIPCSSPAWRCGSPIEERREQTVKMVRALLVRGGIAAPGVEVGAHPLLHRLHDGLVLAFDLLHRSICTDRLARFGVVPDVP